MPPDRCADPIREGFIRSRSLTASTLIYLEGRAREAMRCGVESLLVMTVRKDIRVIEFKLWVEHAAYAKDDRKGGFR